MNTLFGISLLQPLALLSLLAIAIPIVIHLLSKSEGKLIKFGHVALITPVKQDPIAQIQLQQRRLLLLRVLIILCLALLLSQLYGSPKFFDSNRNTSVALVSEAWLNSATEQQKKDLSSALNGQQALLLNSNTTYLSADDIQRWPSTPYSGPELNLWAVIADKSPLFSAGTAFDIYSTDSLSQFVGGKIRISNSLKWQLLDSTENKSTSEITNLSVVVVSDESSTTMLPYWQNALRLVQENLVPGLKITYLNKSQYAQYQIQNDTFADWTLNLTTTDLDHQPNDIGYLRSYLFQAEFPLILGEALMSHQAYDHDLHQHRVTVEQLQKPGLQTRIETETKLPVAQRSEAALTSLWSTLFAALLVVLFCVERIFSEKNAVALSVFEDKS